jgi:hypothetical protein
MTKISWAIFILFMLSSCTAVAVSSLKLYLIWAVITLVLSIYLLYSLRRRK